MVRLSLRRGARICAWVLSATTVLLAVMLIRQCADIYFTGNVPENFENGVLIQPIYSREIVSARFEKTAWAAWLWLASLIAAVIARTWTLYTPNTGLPVANRLEIMSLRTEPTKAMLKERRNRSIAQWILWGLTVVCGIVMFMYFYDLEHFASRDLESTVGRMLLYCLPFTAIALAAWMTFEQYSHKSMQREIAAAKDAQKRKPESLERKRDIRVVQIVLYAAAVALIVAGVLNGGMRDVLIKAINICTECIGLG